ncbi:MAG: 30S ribosome-binding factor RbfA, partial [Gemmatimonadetes bacterium]|nr:30S ribosome-binding factor RbfA [Gemmatimonadota bacterium]
MAHRRTARVADLVKQEVSQIIQHEMKDPRIGFVTVTSVDVSVDLRHARVYFSVLGTQEDQKASLEGLERAKGYI